MSEEEKKVTEEMAEEKKAADELKESADKWLKYVDEKSEQLVNFVKDSAAEISETVKKERRKLELKSQIGEHQRALNKTYMRLGEAYYDAQNDGRALTDHGDLLQLVKLNRELIDVLSKQLEEMTPKAEPVNAESVEEEKPEE